MVKISLNKGIEEKPKRKAFTYNPYDKDELDRAIAIAKSEGIATTGSGLINVLIRAFLKSMDSASKNKK